MSILVDAGAWYALADASDRHHPAARSFYQERAGRASFVTTDLILAESWTLLRWRLGRQVALTFWQTLRDLGWPVLTAEPADLEAAWRIAQRYPDQDFSFVDCTTFALMERHGIQDAFAFDAHFLVYRYGLRNERSFRRLPS